jgi:predicted P-loop ATPase
MAPNVVMMPGVVSLDALLFSEYLPILAGQPDGDDRSAALTKLAHEAYGWENLAAELGIPITPADSLIQQAAAALGIEDKWRAVVETINQAAAVPIQQKKAGKDKVAARLRKLAVKSSQSGKKDKELRKLNKLELHDFLESRFNIVFDTWKGEIIVDGEAADVESLHIKLAVEYGMDVGKESAIDTVTYIANQNEKDDVLDYLRSLENATPLPAEQWEKIGQLLIGSSDPFDSTLLQRMLISAVARIYDPGCKVDECVVLQGPQGLGKSSILECLAGQDFFTDELGDFSGHNKKDACAKLRTNWFVEIAELDKLTSRKESGELKSFITTKIDDYRPAYARTTKKFKRRNIFVATVNPPQFLNDATGNRRYPVIRVTRPIDIAKISEYRDQIWAAAVQAYKRGERWWYSPEETAMINKRAESYEFEDPWEMEILNYIEGKDFTSTKSILEFALKLEPGKSGNRESARVCKILSKAGWWSGKKRRVEGDLINPWYPPRTECQTELESAESVEKVQELEAIYSIPDVAIAERQMEPDKRERLEELRHQLPADKLVTEVQEFVDAAEHGPDVLASVLDLYRQYHPATKRQIWAAIPSGLRAKIHKIKEAQKDVNAEAASSTKPSYSEP